VEVPLLVNHAMLLSFCTRSTQYKTVLDALRSRKDRFLFEDVEISLRTSVMAFM
jgi:dynein heavy chain